MRRLLFRHCRNIRDIGGYPLTSGGYVPYGRFIRSDAPCDVSEEEIHLLLQKRIKTVIDLRYSDERERNPCALEGVEGFHYYHYSIGNGYLPKTEDDISESYLAITQNEHIMKQVFKTMADAKTGVLYHCTAGKDRTGIITALLLSLAGVMECDILADYEVSYTYIRDMIASIKEDNPDLPAFAGRSKTQYMEGFLQLFYNRYQDVEQYLLHIGVSKREVEKLKIKLGSQYPEA